MHFRSNAPQEKLALVVDDSAMQCRMLSVLLKEEGYKVFTANDGARGVAMYIKYKPDLVLMDINMPVMDGFEAARKIKELSKGNLAPLIFITSMDTDEAFIEAIDAGGDGILVRPFSPDVFKAKIKSIQRISDLYSQVKQLQQEQQQDAELAEQLMSGVIESRNYALDKISIIKQAADLFSGDIQLSAECPNGDVNILLGDFTGHGLRSSIGAIPLAETFRAMTRKGFSLNEIISQINQQLYSLLPHDLFLAAAFANISQHDQSVYLLNAGLPDAYILDEYGKIKHRVSSSHPPLGVLPKLLPDTRLSVHIVEPNDQVFMISDGIIEVRNTEGEMYGVERFEAFVADAKGDRQTAAKLLEEIRMFSEGMPHDDDLSVIQAPCSGWRTNDDKHQLISSDQHEVLPIAIEPNWEWQIELVGNKLAKVNPVPMAMNQIQQIEDDSEHWQSVFTIITELYVNALDHGVLELDSEIKNQADGFVTYFNERELRLNHLESGYVRIELEHYIVPNGGKIVVRIKDSGSGFDINDVLERISKDKENTHRLSGRGIDLVRQMSSSLSYSENGTKVEAGFIWQTTN